MPIMRRVPERWPALCALTVGCAMAHAALLYGGMTPTVPVKPAVDGAVAVRLIVAEPPPTNLAADTPDRTLLARGGPPRPVAPRSAAVAPPHPATAGSASAPPALPRYLPTEALDVKPMPRSAPDERHVDSVPRSGLPIRVRVFVEAEGSVSAVNVLSHAPGDEDAAHSMAEMFRETAFIPGRLTGRDVASFIDIELVLEPTLPPPIPLAHY
jgi:hypothetical protein